MNMDAISSGCFKMVEKLIAHSVLHGGPGLPGRAPAVTKYLVSGSVTDAADLVTVDDIRDIDLRCLTENKAACVSVATLMQYFLMAAFCWMLVEGIYLYLFVGKVYNIAEKMHLYHAISWGFPMIMVGISLSIAAGKKEFKATPVMNIAGCPPLKN